MRRIVFSETFRYLVVGGFTTLVNFLVFAFLCNMTFLGGSMWGITIANAASIIAAILFAYVANKKIVFCKKSSSVKAMLIEMSAFIAARMSTMVLEIAGVWVSVAVLKWNEMLGKLGTQVLVLVGNYFISKYLIFRRTDGG